MEKITTCPACGSKEQVYYCKNCNRYWCNSLNCPNHGDPFVRNKYTGELDKGLPISVCNKCKSQAIKC